VEGADLGIGLYQMQAPNVHLEAPMLLIVLWRFLTVHTRILPGNARVSQNTLFLASQTPKFSEVLKYKFIN